MKLALVLLIGVVSCSGDAGAPSPASDASEQWEDFDRIDAAPDGGEPRDAESPPPDAQVLDAAFDAAIPAAWGEMPALCPNPVEYDDVRPDAFERIYVTGGFVFGAGRLRADSVDVLGVLDPRSTEDTTVGAILRYDVNARSHISLDTGGALVLEFWPSPHGVDTVFAFEGRPEYDAPGCLGPAIGSSIVAFEIDDLADPWVLTARGCLDYSAYWQREIITDTDGDGLPEVLTSEIPRLDELNPDGTFTKLWEGTRDGVYPRRVPESISLGSADLDGDGFAEFSVSTSFEEGPPELFGRGALRIMEYDPTVGYVVRHQAIAPFYLPYWQSTGDVDGDGHPELLYGGPADNCRWLGLYHAIANDTYALKWGGSFNDPEGYYINEARMGDTDGDGDDEVILPSGCHVRVLEWNGTRLVQVGDIPVDEHCDEPDAFPADLDGDGADEVVVTTRWKSSEGEIDPTGVAVWKRRRDLP
jgi:hypothetical protein